ncbi:amidohydrolase 2 [Phellopilus nigrolimitatus]|nr:amidohydrolase 2 [Phellopilus nigrolimitatus]
MATKKLLVDIHTHVYLPRYANVLRSRSAVPRIVERAGPQGGTEERLVILENEPISGRPIGPQYWDRSQKLSFMDKHGIDLSVVSSANPWLDFMPPAEATTLASELNDDLEAYCSSSPAVAGTSLRRLYGFDHEAAALKGIIMGTRGIGRGLDDEQLEPVWRALADAGLIVFLHPHYGVDGKAFGEKDNGHVLPLALGFPFETTIATTRLILSGVFDRYPTLRLLLAHSGGALTQLSSRLASCITHDPVVASRLQHDARFYLGQLYYDAVAYGSEELGFVSDVISRADGYASLRASAKDSAGKVDRTRGSKRMLFGTDHPFFPPLSETEKWKSVIENLEAIEGVQGWSEEDRNGVRGSNALELFGLQV